MISCILLSGGASRRFGSPKALASINGRTVIEDLQHRLLDTPIDDIIIILGAHLTEIKPCILEHKKIRSVYNKDHILGQTSSFQCGLAHIKPDCRWVFLLPVDHPFISRQTILTLIEASVIHADKKIIIPIYRGKKGHPPLFAQPLFQAISELNSNAPLNGFMKNYAADTSLLEVKDEGVLLSFNTLQEFEGIKSKCHPER